MGVFYMQAIVIGVVLLIFGIVVFINLIEIGVRNGINSSIIGKSLEEKNGIKVDEKSSFNQDLEDKK